MITLNRTNSLTPPRASWEPARIRGLPRAELPAYWLTVRVRLGEKSPNQVTHSWTIRRWKL